jgi:hypothetical protein
LLCPLSWRIQIGSRLQQYSDWIASLSKIDPQPAQLNDVDLLGCPLSWRIQIGSCLQQYSDWIGILTNNEWQGQLGVYIIE